MSDILPGGDEIVTIRVDGRSEGIDQVVDDLKALEAQIKRVDSLLKGASGAGDLKKKLGSVASEYTRMATEGSLTSNKQIADIKKLNAEVGNLEKSAQKLRKSGMFGFDGDIKKNHEAWSKWQKDMQSTGQPVVGNPKSWSMLSANLQAVKKDLGDVTKAGVATQGSMRALEGGPPVFLKQLSGAQQFRAQLQIGRKELDGFFWNMQNKAKDNQWLGRQMIQGITVPILGLGAMAVNAFQGFNKEVLQLKKVTEFKEDYKGLTDEINNVAMAYGLTQRAVAGLFTDVAALGKRGADIGKWSDSIAQLAMVSGMDMSGATNLFRTIDAIFSKGSGAARFDQTNQTIANLSAIADDTSIQLKDLAAAIPTVAPVMKDMGFSAEGAAAAIAGMYKRGIDANEAATGLKFGLMRLVNPTKDAKALIDELGFSFFNSKGQADDANVRMAALSQQLEGMSDESRLKALGEMFGSRQAARMSSFFADVSQGVKELQAAQADGIITTKEAQQMQSDWARSLIASGVVAGQATEPMDRYRKAVEQFKNDPSTAIDRIKTSLHIMLQQLGATIAPALIIVGEQLVKFLKLFADAPAGFQVFVIGLAGIVAAVGPLKYVFAQAHLAISTLGMTIDKVLPKMVDITAAEAKSKFGVNPNRTDITQVGDRFMYDPNLSMKDRLKKRLGMKMSQDTAFEDSSGQDSEIKANTALEVSNTELAASESLVAAQVEAATAAMEQRAIATKEVATAQQMQLPFGKDSKPYDGQQSLFDADKVGKGKAVAGIADDARDGVNALEELDSAADKTSRRGLAGLADKAKGAGGFVKNIFTGNLGGGGFLATITNVVMKFNVWTFVISVVIGLVVALVAGIKEIKKHWDQIYARMEPGINAIKAAFEKVKAAVGEIASKFAGVFGQLGTGSGADEANSTINGIGDTLNKLAEVVAKVVEFVAQAIKWMWPLFERTAYIIKDVVGFISSLLTGDWKQAFEFAGAVVYEFARPFIMVAQKIVQIVAIMVSKVINLLAWLADSFNNLVQWFHSNLSIIGNLIGWTLQTFTGGQEDKIASGLHGASKAVQDWANNVDWVGSLDQRFRKDLGGIFKDGTAGAADDSKDEAKDAGNAVGEAISDGVKEAAKGVDWFKDWISAVKSELDKAVDAIRKSATDAMEAAHKAAMEVYDERVKAIETQEKAEEKLYKTEEYLARKKELLDKRALDHQNYLRERALAIYEGRINDARMLDLTEQKGANDSAKDIGSLDTSRQRDLVKEARDALKDQIKAEKDAAEQTYQIRKKSFEDQLALITQYAPKTVEEFDAMLSAINSLLQANGVSAWPEMAKGGMARFQEVFAKANKNIVENFFWSGKDQKASWLAGWISEEALAALIMTNAATDAGTNAGNALSNAMDNAFGSGPSLDIPPIETPEVPVPDTTAYDSWVEDFKAGLEMIGNWMSDRWANIRHMFENIFGTDEKGAGSWEQTDPNPQQDNPDYADGSGGQQPTLSSYKSNLGRYQTVSNSTSKATGAYMNTVFTSTGEKITKVWDKMSNSYKFVATALDGSTRQVTADYAASWGMAVDQAITYTDEFGNVWTQTANGIKNQYGEMGTTIINESGQVTGIMNQRTGQVGAAWKTNSSQMVGATIGANGQIVGSHASAMTASMSNTARMGSHFGSNASAMKFVWGLFSGGLPGAISGAIGVVGGVIGSMGKGWSTVVQFMGNMWVNFLNGLRLITNFGSAIWNGFVAGFKWAVNQLITMWNSLDFGIHVNTPFGRVNIDDIFPDINFRWNAAGGYYPAKAGGTLAGLAEAGYDEYIISTDPKYRSRSMSFMAQAMGKLGAGSKTMNSISAGAMSTASPMASVNFGGSSDGGRVIGGTHNTIVVDTFIGQEQWFNELMKKHDIKVKPKERRIAGQQKRVVSSYNDRWDIK